MEHKSFPGHAEVKDVSQGLAEVVVSAYGNLDHDGDIVLPGATSKQISGDYGPRNPKGMLDHSLSMLYAVAKTNRMWEEDDGLHIDAQYNLDKEIGRDAFSDLKFYGDDMEFSVSYDVRGTVEPTKKQREQGVKRIIKEWAVPEWSHVWLGANSQTHLVSAKALQDNIDDLSARVDELLAKGVLSVDEIKRFEDVASGCTIEGTGADTPAKLSLPAESAVEREPDQDDERHLLVAKFRHLVATTRY